MACRLKRFRQTMIAIMMIRSKLTRTPIAMYRFDVDPTREIPIGQS